MSQRVIEACEAAAATPNADTLCALGELWRAVLMAWYCRVTLEWGINGKEKGRRQMDELRRTRAAAGDRFTYLGAAAADVNKEAVEVRRRVRGAISPTSTLDAPFNKDNSSSDSAGGNAIDAAPVPRAPALS